MSDIQINVEAGSQTRLLTAQKYCPSDILVTAGNGSAGIDELLERSVSSISSDVNVIADYALYGCSFLTAVNLPNVAHIGRQAMTQCAVQKMYMPSLLTLDLYAFQASTVQWFYCIATDIGQNSYYGSSQLAALILGGNNVATLQSGAFANTPIASGTGYVYVPDDLVDQYKVATNWVTYADQIKGLSELPAEVQEWLNQQGGATT